MKLAYILANPGVILVPLMSVTLPVYAANPPLKTGMDVKQTQTLEVNGVKIENFAGRVTHKSLGTGKTVRVSLQGSDELLKQVVVTDEHEADKGNLYIAFDESAPILKDINSLTLTLEMPATMPLDLTLVGGKGTIGNRETNDTKININGFGDITLASAKNLESKIDGSGEIIVKEITGNATLAIRGDGSYILERGTIPYFKASIAGTGIIHVSAEVKDADLKSDGAGSLNLATVTGHLNQSMSGAGNISIAKFEGSLKNKSSGSTQLEMNCGKKKKA